MSEMQGILLSNLNLKVSRMWINRRFPEFTTRPRRVKRVKVPKYKKFEFTPAMDDFLIKSARRGTIPHIDDLFHRRYGVSPGRDRIRTRYAELGIDLMSVDGYRRLTDVAVACGVTQQMMAKMNKEHITKIGNFLYFTNEYAEHLIAKYKMPQFKSIDATETARLLGCTNGWVNKLITSGKLEAIKVGGRWRIYEHNELIRNARRKNERR